MIIGLNVDVKLRSLPGPLCGAHIDTSTLIQIHLLEGYGSSTPNRAQYVQQYI